MNAKLQSFPKILGIQVKQNTKSKQLKKESKSTLQSPKSNGQIELYFLALFFSDKSIKLGGIRGTTEVVCVEMGTLTAALVLPSKLKPAPFTEGKPSFFLHRTRRRTNKNQSVVPVARLFGPAIFEASKLKVLFLGVEKKHPGKFPRTYTLTHSDITSKLTLAISQTINNSQLQGWYNRLQRDEVVAEWKKIRGKMSLHVHCHISGGHFLLDLCARLRYYIFCKELPVVLKAFVHGDEDLFNNYPELQDALVWVYFHSNIPEFNKVECWGPLKEPSAPSGGPAVKEKCNNKLELDTLLQPCPEDCSCCFPPMSLIPWRPQHLLSSRELLDDDDDDGASSKCLDHRTFLSGGSS